VKVEFGPGGGEWVEGLLGDVVPVGKGVPVVNVDRQES
jgi:hypothetical protein